MQLPLIENYKGKVKDAHLFQLAFSLPICAASVSGGMEINMYIELINEIKHFLSQIYIDPTILNADAFQGVFIKKLSNQNIVRAKRRVPKGNTISPVNQTHIDITGNNGMLFYFEELASNTTSVQNIDVDIFANNFSYLDAIDSDTSALRDGYTLFSRSTTTITGLINNNRIYHSTAFKKYGHNGKQVQLNIPNQEEYFSKLHNLAYLDDALIMLRYDYFHYLAIIIPNELCVNLYNLTHTFEKQNINNAIINPSYNPDIAEHLQRESES